MAEIPAISTFDVKKTSKRWDKLPINWCWICSVNSSNGKCPFDVGSASTSGPFFSQLC